MTVMEEKLARRVLKMEGRKTGNPSPMLSQRVMIKPRTIFNNAS